MNYRRVIFWLVVTALLLSTPCGVGAQEQDFNTELFIFLSGYLKMEAPTTIEIEVISLKEIKDFARDIYHNACMSELWRNRNYEVSEAQSICRNQAKRNVANNYLHGIWIAESDPLHFHIKVDKHSVDIETLTHEFVHFWLATTVNSWLGNERVVRPITSTILQSTELEKWLERRNR